jgi:hypothetical protein
MRKIIKNMLASHEKAHQPIGPPAAAWGMVLAFRSTGEARPAQVAQAVETGLLRSGC